MLFDHFLISSDISLQLKLFHTENISRLTKIPFLLMWVVYSLVLDPTDEVDHLMNLYNSTLREVTDEHVPLRIKEMLRRPLLPWYNKDIQADKRNRRYCERVWIRTNFYVHFDMSRISKFKVRNTLASTKSEYYNKKFKACKRNQRTVFSAVNKVLHKR